MHLVDVEPSLEGLLVQKLGREYVLAVPAIVTATGVEPSEFRARWVRVPRERVAFYEVLG